MTNSKDLVPRPGSRQAWNDQQQRHQAANSPHQVRDLEAYGNNDPDVETIGGTTGDEKKGCWASFSGCITGNFIFLFSFGRW